MDLSQGWPCPQGTSGNVWIDSDCHNSGGLVGVPMDIKLVVTWDVGKHPTMRRTNPDNEGDLASRAIVQKWRHPHTEDLQRLWPSWHSLWKSQTWAFLLDGGLTPAFWQLGFPGGISGKESACQCRRCKRCGFDPGESPVDRGAWWATVLRVTKS